MSRIREVTWGEAFVPPVTAVAVVMPLAFVLPEGNALSYVVIFGAVLGAYNVASVLLDRRASRE